MYCQPYLFHITVSLCLLVESLLQFQKIEDAHFFNRCNKKVGSTILYFIAPIREGIVTEMINKSIIQIAIIVSNSSM